MARPKPVTNIADARKPAPEIRTTLGVLVDAVQSLGRIVSLPMTAKAAYHVAKLARLVEVETKLFGEKRQELITRFGMQREPTDAERQAGASGPITEVTADRRADYLAEIEALASVDVVIPWGPIDRAWLADARLEPRDFLTLDALMTGEV